MDESTHKLPRFYNIYIIVCQYKFNFITITTYAYSSIYYDGHNFFDLNFKLITIDKNTEICYFLDLNPAWLQVLKQKDLPNWTRPLEDKMNISQLLDQTANSLEKVDWKKVSRETIYLWVNFFRAVVALAVITYLTGEALGHGVHRLNEWLATKWLQVSGLAGTTELGLASPTNVEIVEETIDVEVDSNIPPTTDEVGEIQELQEQPQPSPRRRRRQSAPPAVVQAVEAEFSKPRRPRGQRAHARRHQAA